MRQLRVGIIGCGKIFPMHAYSLLKVAAVKLVAVCDIKKNRAQEKATDFECKWYGDYQEMILKENLDALHICTPHHLHREMAEFAMNKGINVLCEKPAAIEFTDVLALAEIKEKTQTELMISFQNRFNQSSIEVKKIIESGQLGKPLAAKASLTWRRTDDYYETSDWKGTWDKEGGGVVIDQGIHTLDLLNWLLNLTPEAISASIGNRGHSRIEVEDFAEGVIYYEQEIKATFNFMNYYSHDEPIDLQLEYTNGSVKFSGDDAIISFNSGITIDIGKNPSTQFDIAGTKQYWGVGHQAEISYFYDCLINKQPVRKNSIETVLKTHHLVAGIYRSGKSGIKVKLTN